MTKERFTEIVEKYSIDDADMTELAEAVTAESNADGEDYKAKYESLRAEYIDRFFNGEPEKDDADDGENDGADEGSTEEEITLEDLIRKENEDE